MVHSYSFHSLPMKSGQRDTLLVRVQDILVLLLLLMAERDTYILSVRRCQLSFWQKHPFRSKGSYDSVEEVKRKSTSCYYSIQEILQFLQQHGLANYHCLSRPTSLHLHQELACIPSLQHGTTHISYIALSL